MVAWAAIGTRKDLGSNLGSGHRKIVRIFFCSLQGPHNTDHHDGNFFWADISAFTIFSDPDFCYEVMPKIFKYLTDNTELEEKDIYITFNDILPHHVGRNGNFKYLKIEVS